MVIDVTNIAHDQLTEIGNLMQDSMIEQIEEVARELGVDDETAMDVWYIRNRSRHTPELEKELILLHKEGKPPNICNWP